MKPTIILILLAVCLSTCLHEDSPSPYAGEWRGTTDENLPVYLRVLANGIIDSCTLTINFTYRSFSCDLGYRAKSDTTIRDGSFVIPISGVAPSTLRGNFTSETTASGTYDSFKSEIFILECGGSFYQGKVTHKAGTWQATRQ